ncbi:MAG: response regulator [Rhodospirillaceae bacterium]|nr:response regulator [Rhodospirillaceae bacterium]
MSKRILVIDDDENVRDTFAFVLENSGYDVTRADSGLAGIDSAAAHVPDLIFLDLKMPGLNGVETLRRLAEVCPRTPVYIVTGFYNEFLEPLRALKDSGISFDVARKPLALQEIKAIADSVLHAQVGRRTIAVSEALS